MGCRRRLVGLATWCGLTLCLAAPAGASAALGSSPVAIPVTDGQVLAEQVVGNTLYIGGTFSHVALATGPAALFATGDGALSTLPTITGGLGLVTTAIPDRVGGWYIAGKFSRVGGLVRTDLVHVLADGTVDPAFVPPRLSGATVDGSAIGALALVGSTLYVGGTLSAPGATTPRDLVALDAADGSIGTAFTGNPDGPVMSLLVAGTTLYLAGDFDTVGGDARRAVAAIDLTSSKVEPAFAPPITSGNGFGLALAGSTLYLTGAFVESGTTSAGVAALDATDGQLIPGFAPSVFVGGDGPVAASTSAVFVTAQAGPATGSPTEVVALDPATGGRLAGFSAVTDGYVTALHMVAGDLYVGGQFGRISGAARRNLAVVDATTGAASPTTFDPNGWVGAVSAAGGEVLAAGGFESVRGAARRNLAAIDLTTNSVIGGFDPEPDGAVLALVRDGAALYVGGQFSHIATGARASLAALDPVSGALLPFDAQLADARLARNGNPPDVTGLTGNGTDLYVTGEFDRVGAAQRAGLAAVDEHDGAATPFAADLGGSGATLLLSGSTLYVGGAFSFVGGRSHNGIAALDAASGAPEAGFNAQVHGWVTGLARAGQTVYVVGSFDAVDQLGRHDVAAVDAVSGAVLPFDPQVDGAVAAVAVDRGLVELGGQFDYVAGVPRASLAELDPAGAPMPFDPEVYGAIGAETVAADGSLFAGGSVLTDDHGPGGGLTEFSPTATAAAGNLTPPSLSGTPAPGQELTCDPGSWSSGVDQLSYTWLRDGHYDSASTSARLAVGDLDAGHDLACQVTGESAGGSASATTGVLAVPGAVPVIGGSSPLMPAPAGPLAAGQYLLAPAGAWSTDPVSLRYQWERCDLTGAVCEDIAGATDRGYQLTSADVGAAIRVVVEALDNAGASAPITSDATQPIPSGLPQNTSPPDLGGRAEVGYSLTVDVGVWTQAPNAYLFQWERCAPDGTGCEPIPGANESAYQPTAADLGRTVVVVVSPMNGYGIGQAVTSAPSNIVYSSAGGQSAPAASPTQGPIAAGQGPLGGASPLGPPVGSSAAPTSAAPDLRPGAPGVGARPTPRRLTVSVSLGASTGLLDGGLVVRARCSSAADLRVALTITAAAARHSRLGSGRSALTILVVHAACGATVASLRLRARASIVQRLLATRPPLTLTAQARQSSGLRSPVIRRSVSET